MQLTAAQVSTSLQHVSSEAGLVSRFSGIRTRSMELHWMSWHTGGGGDGGGGTDGDPASSQHASPLVKSSTSWIRSPVPP